MTEELVWQVLYRSGFCQVPYSSESSLLCISIDNSSDVRLIQSQDDCPLRFIVDQLLSPPSSSAMNLVDIAKSPGNSFLNAYRADSPPCTADSTPPLEPLQVSLLVLVRPAGVTDRARRAPHLRWQDLRTIHDTQLSRTTPSTFPPMM